MRRVTRLLTFLAIALGIRWVVGARRRADETGRPWREVMSRDLRAFVTHRIDPLVLRLGLAGGRRSPWAILEHVGRTTGAIHRTPVLPALAENVLFIPLPYGPEVHLVKNVLASGHCRIQWHENLYELDEPAIVMAEENTALPAPAHEALDATAAHYLRLHVLDRAPGTFTNPPAEFTTHRIPAPVPEIEMVHPTPKAAPVA